MASLEELQSRLAMLQEGLDELGGLVARLGASGSAADGQQPELLDEDATADLAAEIGDGLRDARDEHELLQEDVLDVAAADDHDRARLREGLARLDREMQAHHVAFRKARLRARHALEAAQKREQLEMLEEYAYPEDDDDDDEDDEDDDDEDDEDDEEDDDDDDDDDGGDDNDDDDNDDTHTHTHTHTHSRRLTAPTRKRPPPPPVSTASTAATAAADVTAALRQTHARIAGEVARSDFAAQTLAESSRALADLGDRYGGGGNTRTNNNNNNNGDISLSLQSARYLVRGLVAAHKSDTWYLQTALYLVAATAVWLLFRRLLYGPLWLLVWWPLRSVWSAASSSAVAVGLVGVRVGSSSSSSFTGVISSSAVTRLSSAAPPPPSAIPLAASAADGSAESLVQHVGQIVDDASQQQQQQQQQQPPPPPPPQQQADAQPNPMKRMWEEDAEVAKHEEQTEREQAQGRPKDEL